MRKLRNEELGRISIEEFRAGMKSNICLVLDDIRSLNNVGSIFRTADAFRVEKVWLCGITGKPPHRDIQKTALGATESVDWEYVSDVSAAIDQLREEDYLIAAVEQVDKSVLLQNFEVETTSKYAFVFGHEVYGVKDEVIQKADFCLEIPQYGTKHSLNLAVCAGIILWDYTTKVEFGK